MVSTLETFTSSEDRITSENPESNLILISNWAARFASSSDLRGVFRSVRPGFILHGFSPLLGFWVAKEGILHEQFLDRGG